MRIIERLSPTQAGIASCFPQSKPAAHTRFIVRCLGAESPDFLWLTASAATVWGHDAAMQRFQGNRRGTWKVEPRREELRVVEINPGTVPLHTAADVHFRAAERRRVSVSDQVV